MTGSSRRLLEKAAPGVLYADLNACNEYQGTDAAVAKLDCPVTIIAGSEDRMTPAKAARALSEKIPDATFVLIDSVGHNMMLEEPTVFNKAVCKALAS